MAENIQPTMSEDYFIQVMAAIAEERYSLAYILILKSKGYLPSDYNPYRTCAHHAASQ